MLQVKPFELLCSSTDYLKNLPEDSEDYKDTQGQMETSTQCLQVLAEHNQALMLVCFSLHAAALFIVKEVANHANDIMKQGVRWFYLVASCCSCSS